MSAVPCGELAIEDFLSGIAARRLQPALSRWNVSPDLRGARCAETERVGARTIHGHPRPAHETPDQSDHHVNRCGDHQSDGHE
jgi:hypothetical protein